MVEIVESTPRRLVLRKSSRTIRAYLVLGATFALVGCMVGYWGLRTTSVHCARGPAGLTCDVTERLLGFIPFARRRVERVKGATVGYTGDSSDPTYRVELVTDDGDEPLSRISAFEGECRSFVERFNAFVRSGASAGDLLELALLSAILIPLLLMPALFGLALVCFAAARPYRLEVDRDRARLTISGGLSRQASHPLAEIDDVQVEESAHDDQPIQQVFLLLKGGARVRLEIEPPLVDLLGDYVPRRLPRR